MPRFRGDAGLYVHLYLLVADGVWRQTSDGRVEFLPLAEPTRQDLHAVLRAVHDDLHAAGLHDDAPDVDPSLLACAQLSLSTTAATQPRPVDATQLCVDAFDMSLHAATCVDGRDRKRLQRLACYLLRPPFALDALSRTDDGRVRLHIGRHGRAVTMSPQQWLAKLAALVPPPKLHQVRYGGVFMPTAITCVAPSLPRRVAGDAHAAAAARAAVTPTEVLPGPRHRWARPTSALESAAMSPVTGVCRGHDSSPGSLPPMSPPVRAAPGCVPSVPCSRPTTSPRTCTALAPRHDLRRPGQLSLLS